MKFVLEKKQLRLFEKYVLPIVKQYDAEKYVSVDSANCVIHVQKDGLQEVMLCADDAIIAYGMEGQESLTSLGCELQFLYDELLDQKKRHK